MAKILVVDDDPDFVEITRMVLEAHNYEVISAADGKEGIARMRRDKPDLVLLDIMMTHPLDGVEVSKEMLDDAELKKIPIIVVSAIADSPHAGEFPMNEYLHIDDWISKPIQPDVLLNKVRLYLNRSRG